MNNEVKPEKRDERLAREKALVDDFVSGVRPCETLSMDHMLVVGANYPSCTNLAQDFLSVFRKEHPSWVMQEFPNLLTRRIAKQEDDVPKWCGAFFDYIQRHGQAFSPKTSERGCYNVGEMLAYRTSPHRFEQTLVQLKENIPPSFVRGMIEGAFREQTGQNIGVLLQRGFLNAKHVGSYLERPLYVLDRYSQKNYNTKFFHPPVHKKVLQHLYNMGDAEMKDVLLLAAGHLVCRAQSKQTRQVARKFFAKYYSIPHAQEVIAQLDVATQVTFRWGENLHSHRSPFIPLVGEFFTILLKTPSLSLLQQMLFWRENNAKGRGGLLFQNTGLNDTLKEYEKLVLNSQLPKKTSCVKKKM